MTPLERYKNWLAKFIRTWILAQQDCGAFARQEAIG